MGELGLLAALLPVDVLDDDDDDDVLDVLPVDVLAEHAGHPLVGGQGAQLEALHQEEVLELDLGTQCTAAPCSKPCPAPLCSRVVECQESRNQVLFPKTILLAAIPPPKKKKKKKRKTKSTVHCSKSQYSL